MVNRENITLSSATVRAPLFCRIWHPEKAKALIIIIHGVAEHSGRYDGFASFLAEKGIAVAAPDLPGHGKSMASYEDAGCFDGDGSWFTMVEDIDSVRRKAQEIFPDVPVFMLGHSMGSFVLRTYLMLHGEGLTGAVISGTGFTPELMRCAGELTASLSVKRHGPRYKDPLLGKLSFGAYNKRIENPASVNAWLSRDPAVPEAYDKDPLCGFLPSALFFREMIRGIGYIQKKKNIDKIPKTLPLYMFSGDMDPVGEYGKGFMKVYDGLVAAGCRVEKKLYPGGRHEMLNETNKEEVKNDALAFIEKILAE